jgi:hypothetical protein
MDVVSYGSRRLLAAIREENPLMAFVGAALLAYGVIKRLEGPRVVKVYTAKVRRGERFEVAVTDPRSQRTR